MDNEEQQLLDRLLKMERQLDIILEATQIRRAKINNLKQTLDDLTLCGHSTVRLDWLNRQLEYIDEPAK